MEGKSKQIRRGAKVLGKAGLRLGGRDFDKWIIQKLHPNLELNNLVLNAAERLKCRLSDEGINENKKLTETVVANPSKPNESIIFQLTRIELEVLLHEKGVFKSLSKLLKQIFFTYFLLIFLKRNFPNAIL